MYTRSLDLGLLAYLASSQCSQKTNAMILKQVMWKDDFEVIQSKIENQNEGK